ncbi:MAG: Histone acetyltransferase [Alyxoria varia]|nr:MAG: Histone acetyltransferase [Alyxoria varia]
MAPRDSHSSPPSPSSPRPRGMATAATLAVGVRPLVEKDGDKRRAEILSMRTRKGQPEYYVHYDEFNKRLDEWVKYDRLDLSQEVEWPRAEKSDKAEKENKNKAAPAKAETKQPQQQQDKSNKNQKRPRAPLERQDSTAPDQRHPSRSTKASATGKENRDALTASAEVIDGTTTPQPDDEQADLIDVQDAAAAAKAAPPELHSREEEIEKLRTHGSMTQNQAEISRVRNLTRIQMGQHEIEPWYFSPYPSEFCESDLVYICEFCLGYFPEYKPFERHRKKCTLLHPPGNEIYRDAKVSYFEIDGRRQRTWCRNLCLLSKLFLDHKTLYYDVDPFLFYCMCTRDEYGCHLIGYFSKEKESAESYNVACILTLPQYQRQGLGRLLIAFSYELTKRENKLGSPEKPLSDLGLLGYRAYWQEVILDLLLDNERGDMSVDDIASATAMTQNDVLHTLQNLNMLRLNKNQHVVLLTEALVEQREKKRVKEKEKGKLKIEPERLVWKVPVFTASSRTWNW